MGSSVGIEGEPPHLNWHGQTTNTSDDPTAVTVVFHTQITPGDSDAMTEDYCRSFVRYVGLLAAYERTRTTPMMVWVVGESDDHLEGVFTTENAAREARTAKATETYAQGFSDHWWVEELPFNPTVRAAVRYYSDREHRFGPPADSYGVGPDGGPTVGPRDTRPWMSVEWAAERGIVVPANWRQLA